MNRYPLLLLLIVLGACMPMQTLTSERREQLPLAGSRWVLERFADQPVLAHTEITLIFDDTDSRAGGRAGCNSYSAGLVTDDGLRFMNPISTLMACAPEIMAQEGRFFRALESVTDFSLADDTLMLIGDEDLVFRLEQIVDDEAAVFEGDWVLASLNLTDGETVTLLTGFDVTLSMDTTSNTLTGHASCNRYSAPFSRKDNRLQLTGVALTRMACESARMQQEATFVRVLESVTNYHFDNGRLILSGEAGELVFVPQP
jgi:heat shock protein HslJ